MSEQLTPAEVVADRMRRKLQRLLITCRAFNLSRDDRLGIAETMLYRGDQQPPIRSFKDLSEAELDRMLDALHGAVLVGHICAERTAARKRAEEAAGVCTACRRPL